MTIRALDFVKPARIGSAWRAGDAAAPWLSRVAAAATASLRRMLARPARIRVSRVSAEWLRAHELESAKHDDDR